MLAFHNGDVLVLSNLGSAAVPVPDGFTVSLASTPPSDGLMAGIPPNCTVYLTR